MTDSADLDQLASSKATDQNLRCLRSGSTLFAKAEHIRVSRTRVNGKNTTINSTREATVVTYYLLPRTPVSF